MRSETWGLAVLASVTVILSIYVVQLKESRAQYLAAVHKNSRVMVSGSTLPSMAVSPRSGSDTQLRELCSQGEIALMIFTQPDCRDCDQLVVRGMDLSDAHDVVNAMNLSVGQALTGSEENHPDADHSTPDAHISRHAFLSTFRDRSIPAVITTDRRCQVRAAAVGAVASGVVIDQLQRIVSHN